MSRIPNFRQTFNKHYLRPRSLGPIQRFRIPFLIALHIRENSAFINTRIDWKETPEAHVFKADISGQKKEEVKAKIEDDRVLQISRETKTEKEDKNGKWHRIDRIIGKFSRKFRLLENAKVNEIKAAIYGAWGSQCDCS